MSMHYISTHTAVDDDGNVYRIEEWAPRADVTVLADRNVGRVWEGQHSYHLADGTPVARVSDTEFRIGGPNGVISRTV